MKNNIIKEKSFSFAVRVVTLTKHLQEQKREFVLSKQLMRSGTSIGANIRESINAESKADFVHKFGIAQKECDETIYWLELLNATGYLAEPEFTSINNEASELLKIIRSNILTTKQTLKTNS